MDGKLKAWIGIDPGQTGAAALISDTGHIDIADWPGDESEAAAIIEEWQGIYDLSLAILEKVSSMPKQGVSSTFAFGVNFGAWRGILAALKVRRQFLTPRQWQKGLITDSDGPTPKKRSLCVARRLFPEAANMLKREKDHNRADALLMAHVARSI